MQPRGCLLMFQPLHGIIAGAAQYWLDAQYWLEE
jgi:hypothetical protein